MNETILTVFVIATCLAVMIQAGILVGMFLSMKKASERMEGIANICDSGNGCCDVVCPKPASDFSVAPSS